MESAPQNSEIKIKTKITVNRLDKFDAKKIADEFNEFFTNIRTDLANKIPNPSRPFDSYITNVNTSMESQSLSINELKEAFFSLKICKNPCYDGVSFNIVKNVLMSYVNLMMHFFKSIYLTFRSLKGFFLMTEKLRRLLRYIKQTTAVMLVIIGIIICTTGFSKILERIMYSRLQNI